MRTSVLTSPDRRPDHFEPIVRSIEPPRDLAAVRAAVLARPGGFALESLGAAGPSGSGRFSYFGCEPLRVVEAKADADPFGMLAEAVFATRSGDARTQTPLPFIGGWVGYLAYEAGGWLEPSARTRRVVAGLPSAWFAYYDAVLAADVATGRWYAAGVQIGSDESRLNRRIEALEGLARTRGRCESLAPRVAEPESKIAADMSRAEYLAKVERALEYIAAGDIFQVNLARRLTVETRLNYAELYERLCRANPASYAAYVSGGSGWAVLSSSPELYLEVCGERLVTKPIKGTRPRGANGAADAAAREELARSAKDAAELAMIVDLERNDLGRVCRYGSVRVEDAGSIETLPTVFHRVATVAGELRPECGVIDAIRATYPGGSVTGAPKVRAMQIIDELENSPRGPYCGAIGYVNVNGDAMFNLAIRTLVATPGRVELSVGGGIVADSEPAREYDETEAKAAGMLKALGIAKEK